MGEKETVIINGREYDRSTGLPVGVTHLSRQELRSEAKAAKAKTTAKRATRRVATTSSNIHSTLKTSARIDSRFAKKPLAKRKLTYEKIGAEAEAALERALSQKKAEAKTEKTAVVNKTSVAPKPATPKAAPAPIKPVTKAHIPAPAVTPTKPTSTQNQPAKKLSNPTLESIIKKNRQLTRVDGMSAPRQRPAQAKTVQARSLQERTVLQPVSSSTRQTAQSSATYNIPKQNKAKSFNTESVMPHPVAERAQQVQRQKQASRQQQAAPAQPSSVLKNAIVNDTLEKAPKSSHKKLKNRPSKRRMRIVSFASGFAALALFAGYVTYLNVPNISVRVAAAQAGIDASYPGYQPNGYRLSGPVAYTDGEVKMNFVSRQDGSEYTLRESRSSWNSSTLLENYVREASGDDYTISKEKGITVYHFGGDAAWVSGGILYLIDGDTSLTPDEVRKIATSV